MQERSTARKVSQPTSRLEPVDKQIEYVLEEARMVLPGMQALFGFQLIAAFSQRFTDALGPTARVIHLAALLLVALAIALIMAPAAYHRQVQRDRVSAFFVDYASRLITLAMVPLFIALCAEVGVVTIAVINSALLGFVLATVLAVVFLVLWYVVPWMKRERRTR